MADSNSNAAPPADKNHLKPTDHPDPKKKSKGMLHKVGSAIKSSPKMMRKAFGKVKKSMKIGGSKDHSQLHGCKDNGWLHEDETIRRGVNYRVKYLGSVEVDYDPTSTENNQESAQKAMRALYAHTKGSGIQSPTMALQIAINKMTLYSGDGTKIVMRHSTTRIAYSTVDTERPKTFSYVAVVKGTQLALCHVFSCKNAKQGYEMTFVCAQAFDMNFRLWQANREAAKKDALASEKDDIEPTQAWQKKKSAEEKAKMDAALAGKPMPEEKKAGESASSVGGADVPEIQKLGREHRRESIFFAIMEGQDPAELAGNYFESIGVNLIEDDEEDDFMALARHRLDGNSGASAEHVVGVDTDLYNTSVISEGEEGGAQAGYMTVGTDFNFADDDDEFLDDEDEL